MASNSGTYDVFLSFGGNDVRKGFTGHLYAALCRSGINTFVDEEKSEEIGACPSMIRMITLIKEIQKSRLSLVLLSKDYAWSTWCMEELVHILNYKKPDDVWPIFYDVDPSHVEEIQGCYEEAFAEHKKRFNELVLQEWKKALQEVSYLKGLDLQKHLDGHEAENIDYIVKEISRRLDKIALSVAIFPVDIHSRAKQVIRLIATELEDIRIVGIYGMGGIGKSTIAKEVYNSLFHEFDSSCFLENVREVSHSRLQRQLLSETLRRKHEKIDNVDRGLNMIIQSLSQKKVLVVLDDVDKLDQIYKILGNCDWLFPGSRVIITTRIENFLEASGSYWQYEVKELSSHNALKLLSLHAFGKNLPHIEYMDCAERMVHYCGGVPLALEVLGSSLCGQSVDVWNSRLEKLKVIANDDIHSKLKISYDSLGEREQFIFLDIACFFIGYDKDYVTSILNGCHAYPTEGDIKILLRRCLVKIDSDNKLSTHDLLRDMGRETVRQQHVVDPGERTRLWHQEDVIDVLTNKLGTKAIEGLALNMPGLECSWGTKAFKKMKILRLLQLNYVHLIGSYEYISNKLRWLCWREFPLASIPSDLHLEHLVALDLRYSKLKVFSAEEKSLKKLKFLNLNHSHDLVETPDFEGCPNLEKLMFKDCITLEKVYATVGLLSHLRFLSFQDCRNLKNLPGTIGVLTKLEKLNMSGCSKLEKVPGSIGHLTHLIFLNFRDCKSLKDLPGCIGNLKSLQELNMSGCLNLQELPESTGFLTHLTLLNLHDCQNLENLPGSFGDLKSLEKLDMSGCSKLKDLPDSAGSFTSLRSWDLQGCKNLKTFPTNILGLRSLKELKMSGCSKLEELPEDLGNLKSLVVLNLDGTGISTLPENIENLKELKSLSLSECRLLFLPRKSPHIINFLPCSLKELDLSFCKIFDGVIPQDLQGLAQLEDLKLCGNDFTSLPASIGSLSKLAALSLDDCRCLKSIPKLQSTVEALQANHCTSLVSIDLTNFPGDAELELEGCLSLNEIKGYFNLEPLAVEIAEKLLRSSSPSIKDLITNISIRKIDNLAQTNKTCPLQTVRERGIYSIFLPGSEIPTWFNHQSEGDTVSFHVPRHDSSFKIIGVVTCAIYAWRSSSESCYSSPYVTITNNTKMFEWIYTPYVTFFSSDVEQDMKWLCYWMFNDLIKTDEADTNWRFKDEIHEGDELEFSIDVGFGINVRKCGIHLLYQDTDDKDLRPDDLAMISYASSRHHRRFLHSRPRLLTMESIEEATLEKFVASPRNKGFVEWSEKRKQRTNKWNR